MSKKMTKIDKIQRNANKCKDKELVDSYVTQYLNQTKSAVENLLSMSEIIYEMNSKVENGDLNENDLNYFCQNVGLNKKSSYFRKHVCIGYKADFLRAYIEKIPSAVSTIYEITTIDPERIIQLIQKNLLKPNTTLHELKCLAFKSNGITNANTSKKDKIRENISIEFDFNKMDTNTKCKLYDLMMQMKTLQKVKINFELENAFEKELNNVIDVEVKKLKYA
jgi:hypothetical protein